MLGALSLSVLAICKRRPIGHFREEKGSWTRNNTVVSFTKCLSVWRGTSIGCQTLNISPEVRAYTKFGDQLRHLLIWFDGAVVRALPTHQCGLGSIPALWHVGRVCCWFSPCPEGLSGFCDFPPSVKTNVSKFQFKEDTVYTWKPSKADVASSLINLFSFYLWLNISMKIYSSIYILFCFSHFSPAQLLALVHFRIVSVGPVT